MKSTLAILLFVHLAQFGPGEGPRKEGEILHLLDAAGTHGQSNAVALDLEHESARQSLTMKAKVRVKAGGDGGAFAFLSTAAYGRKGPAPYLASWVEPNLEKTFAVALDVHNPKNEEMFGSWGNYLGRPEREVSLHFDGREIVKRTSPVEFRGDDFHDLEIHLEHVTGGAEVTVTIAGEAIYDRYFLAHLLPYESRLAVGASTREDAATEFDVQDVEVVAGEKAARPRPPVHVEAFHHVLTGGKKTAYTNKVALPPAGWAFGRIILTLDIHDAGTKWDEWDRNGEISVILADGTKRGIVPFITSYRTPCHWKVDVTHFRPWLTGETTFEIAAGTSFYKGRGFLMSVALDFHHGTPELEPFDIAPLWHGQAQYKTDENHFQDFFEPRGVAISEGTTAARVFTTTTGHSQIGEFVPSMRTIVYEPVAGEETSHRFPNRLWKDDCYLNPNRPQYGTWKFARAGWAPGDVVRPWWIDLTPHLQAGKTATFRYEPEPYDFSEAARPASDVQKAAAKHIVRSYVILYREPADLVPAPTLRITGVAKDSNAQKAGMQVGDYLAEYDGARVDTIDDLRKALQAAAATNPERVDVVIFRGAERHVLQLAPGTMGVNLGM